MCLMQSRIRGPMRMTIVTWGITGIFLLISLDLFASIMRPLSIDELTRQADAVVRGEVLSKTCERDGQGRIYTQIELAVEEVWKGAVSTNKFMIVLGGGVLGEERVIVTGQVQYDIGEEVVAFIVYNSAHEAVTLGMSQGKFHLHHAPGKSTVYAHNPFHGTTPALEVNKSSKSDAAKIENHSSTDEGLTVEDLKSKVLSAK